MNQINQMIVIWIKQMIHIKNVMKNVDLVVKQELLLQIIVMNVQNQMETIYIILFIIKQDNV